MKREEHDGRRVERRPSEFLDELYHMRIASRSVGDREWKHFMGEISNNPRKLNASLSAPDPYFTGEPYLELQEMADWRDMDPRVMQWAGHFGKAARKLNIPLYVMLCAAPGRVCIRHAIFGVAVSKAEQQYIHSIGQAAADKLSLPMQVAVDEYAAPDWWRLLDAEYPGPGEQEPRRYTLAKLAKLYPSNQTLKKKSA